MSRPEKNHRSIWIAVAMWVLAVGPALGAPAELPQARNHAFDVDVASATACLDGVVFDGVTTGPSSLNLLMTSQAFDQLGTTLLATGDTHVFTAVAERYTFTILYPSTTFAVGAAIGLSVTDNPPTLQGTQGDFANSVRVADCSIATVPTMPGWGTTLLAILLVAAGAVASRRMRTPAKEAGA